MARERHLREAHRLYEQLGATGHVQRISRLQARCMDLLTVAYIQARFASE
jgi:hypothetical protein